MSPRRLALLIGALFLLSTTVAVALGRYPDQERGITTAEANALNEAFREHGGPSYVPSCDREAPDPDAPCVAVHLHNFAARARIIGGAVGVVVLLTALAFRRRLDRGPAPALAHG